MTTQELEAAISLYSEYYFGLNETEIPPSPEQPWIEHGYRVGKLFPSGDWAAVMPITFGRARLVVSDPQCNITGAYCYRDGHKAILALAKWDGKATPDWWYKNVVTGEWRQEFAPERGQWS